MNRILASLFILSIFIYGHGGQSGTPSFGFSAGLMHPIKGLDHLIAMACVGMISSRIGKKAIWQIPLCFVVVMAIGCVFGFYGNQFEFIEPLISLSIIIFGLLLIVPTRLSLFLTFLTVALFAIVHGYAHGKEMPLFVLPEIYIAGFMVATTLIHILGVAIGEGFNRLPNSAIIYKVTGTSLLMVGAYLILG